MNSILRIHFNSSAQGADGLVLALMRFSYYLDTETEVLAQVLDVANRPRTARAIEALSALHLEPDSSDRDIRHLSESARDTLGEVLADIQTIPVEIPTCAPGIEDFDARTRWVGARLQEILATLHWALD